MPLNPQIIAGIDIPQVRSQADIAEDNAKRESANLERQQAAQASRDNMALRHAMARFPTDATAAAEWLGQNGYGHIGVALREQVGKATKSEEDARKSKLDADEKQWQRLNAVSQLITDDASLALARQWVAADDPKLAAFLPETFDGAKVKTFQQMLISAKDKMDDERQRWQAELQAGTTMRGQDMTAQTAKAGQDVTMRGQDISADTAKSGQAVTMRGQDIGAQTAKSGQAVTMRGQDIAASTAIRGQDVSADTQRRGQDLGKTVAGAKGGPDVPNIMGEIDTLSQRINTSAGGWRSVVEGLTRRGAAKTQYDNDVSEYESLINGMIPMVARAVGHTGVLTQQDVDSVRALFPQVGDNKTLAENKMKRVKSLIGGSAPAETVDDGVASALKSVGDGRHTLSDGSVWEKRGNSISKVK